MGKQDEKSFWQIKNEQDVSFWKDKEILSFDCFEASIMHDGSTEMELSNLKVKLNEKITTNSRR